MVTAILSLWYNKLLINSPMFYTNSQLAVTLWNSLQTLESRQSHWVSFDVGDAIKLHQELHGATDKVVFEVMCTPVNPIDVAASSRGIRFTKSRGKQVVLN